jgi:hypothetical protein
LKLYFRVRKRIVVRIRAYQRKFALLALCFGVGCGASSMNTNELSGDYSVRYKHGLEKLTLKTNGTFMQLYTPLGGALLTTNSGTWKFEKTDCRIVLRDVIEFDQWGAGEKQSLERIVWQIRVAKRFGQVSLIINEDEGLEFDKSK